MGAEARPLVGQFYQFVPYNYGPFDAKVYHDLDKLVLEGLVTTVPSGGA
jgi:hypothetical protein